MSKTKFQEFKKRYGFNTGDVKWVLEGGDLLKYVGADLVYIDYKRDPKDGLWNTTVEKAVITKMSDFDPVTMTYQVEYKLPDRQGEEGEKLRIERIIPEGFSFDVMGQGIQNTMNRFTTFSLHNRLLEEGIYYDRVLKLWDKRDTLPFGALKALNENKDLVKTLKYAKNIVVAIRPLKETEQEDVVEWEDEVLVFRLCGLKLKHDFKETWRLFLTDEEGKTYNLLINEGETEFYEFTQGLEVIGDLKIIDLIDDK